MEYTRLEKNDDEADRIIEYIFSDKNTYRWKITECRNSHTESGTEDEYRKQNKFIFKGE